MIGGRIGALLLVAIVVTVGACVDIEREQCGHSPNSLGNNAPGTARVRTSHYRAVLADTSAVDVAIINMSTRVLVVRRT
jgi:hypothetical protein